MKVGKGWFNLKESNKDSFELGKFKKLLNTIRMIREDTVY